MTTNIAGNPAVRQESSADLIRQTLVIVATVATIFVNYLANALPINGLDTGAISDRFDVFFVPSGYVFSIWGLIYLGLVGYSIYQALPAQRTNPQLRAIAPFYLLTAVANIGWIFLWHYEQFVFTIPVMLLLLASLIAIYQRLDASAHLSRAGQWLVRIPFVVYLGWITVATVANITSTLDYVNWGGWGLSESVWFWLILAVATLIGAGFAWLRREVAYVAVLIWAFAGIAVKHSATTGIAGAAIVAAVAVAIILVMAFLARRQPRTTPHTA